MNDLPFNQAPDDEALALRDLSDEMAELYGFPQETADKIAKALDVALEAIMNAPSEIADFSESLGTTKLEKAKFASVSAALLVCAMQGYITENDRFNASKRMLTMAQLHTQLKRGL